MGGRKDGYKGGVQVLSSRGWVRGNKTKGFIKTKSLKGGV
jgi:hypothetical protein